MLETPHVIVGAAIATKVVNPAISIPLAFASHFLLEKIPHWNPHLNRELKTHGHVTKSSKLIIAADVVSSLALGGWIAARALPNTTHSITILAACLASILPDLVEAPYFFANYRNKLLIRWLHWQKSLQEDATFIPGVLTQLIVIATTLYWII